MSQTGIEPGYICKPDTCKLRKGRSENVETNVNAQADRANNEHSKCSRKKEHGKREKVGRETAHEEHTG